MLKTFGVRYKTDKTSSGTALEFVKATDEAHAKTVFEQQHKDKVFDLAFDAHGNGGRFKNGKRVYKP